MSMFKPDTGLNVNRDIDMQYSIPAAGADMPTENDDSKSSSDSISGGVKNKKDSSISTSSSTNEMSIEGSVAFVEQNDCTMRRKSTDAQSF